MSVHQSRPGAPVWKSRQFSLFIRSPLLNDEESLSLSQPRRLGSTSLRVPLAMLLDASPTSPSATGVKGEEQSARIALAALRLSSVDDRTGLPAKSQKTMEGRNGSCTPLGKDQGNGVVQRKEGARGDEEEGEGKEQHPRSTCWSPPPRGVIDGGGKPMRHDGRREIDTLSRWHEHRRTLHAWLKEAPTYEEVHPRRVWRKGSISSSGSTHKQQAQHQQWSTKLAWLDLEKYVMRMIGWPIRRQRIDDGSLTTTMTTTTTTTTNAACDVFWVTHIAHPMGFDNFTLKSMRVLPVLIPTSLILLQRNVREGTKQRQAVPPILAKGMPAKPGLPLLSLPKTPTKMQNRIQTAFQTRCERRETKPSLTIDRAAPQIVGSPCPSLTPRVVEISPYVTPYQTPCESPDSDDSFKSFGGGEEKANEEAIRTECGLFSNSHDRLAYMEQHTLIAQEELRRIHDPEWKSAFDHSWLACLQSVDSKEKQSIQMFLETLSGHGDQIGFDNLVDMPEEQCEQAGLSSGEMAEIEAELMRQEEGGLRDDEKGALSRHLAQTDLNCQVPTESYHARSGRSKHAKRTKYAKIPPLMRHDPPTTLVQVPAARPPPFPPRDQIFDNEELRSRVEDVQNYLTLVVQKQQQQHQKQQQQQEQQKGRQQQSYVQPSPAVQAKQHPLHISAYWGSEFRPYANGLAPLEELHRRHKEALEMSMHARSGTLYPDENAAAYSQSCAYETTSQDDTLVAHSRMHVALPEGIPSSEYRLQQQQQQSSPVRYSLESVPTCAEEAPATDQIQAFLRGQSLLHAHPYRGVHYQQPPHHARYGDGERQSTDSAFSSPRIQAPYSHATASSAAIAAAVAAELAQTQHLLSPYPFQAPSSSLDPFSAPSMDGSEDGGTERLFARIPPGAPRALRALAQHQLPQKLRADKEATLARTSSVTTTTTTTCGGGGGGGGGGKHVEPGQSKHARILETQANKRNKRSQRFTTTSRQTKA